MIIHKTNFVDQFYFMTNLESVKVKTLTQVGELVRNGNYSDEQFYESHWKDPISNFKTDEVKRNIMWRAFVFMGYIFYASMLVPQ